MTTINKHRIVFFSLEDAIQSEIGTKTGFIIANERKKKNGEIGRYYTVFSKFSKFLRYRDEYKHCHELFVDHKDANQNISGRLVFDFDIKMEKIPFDFKNQIEDVVCDVIEMYMKDVDINRLKFIWSSSNNPNKFSKHLTVKNMYFDNWIWISKTFYNLFCKIWDEKHIWISSNNLIDLQIVRKKASLRMVGSSKIGGNVLTFDDHTHTLEESLIRIYQKKDKLNEQLITKDNFNESMFEDIFEPITKFKLNITSCNNSNYTKMEDPEYNLNVYDIAYKLSTMVFNDIFKKGKVNGYYLNLLRNKPAKCKLSEQVHESENGYLYIKKDDLVYTIFFGCFRRCNPTRKFICLGTICCETNNIIINNKIM